MEAEMKSLIQVWVPIMASLCYCCFISSRFRPGKSRLFSLLPVLYLLTLLPLRLSGAFSTAVTVFLITWLTNFKLLLFAFGHGPLSSHPPKPLPVFLAAATLPIRTAAVAGKPSRPRKIPQNLAAEFLAFSIIITALENCRQILHPKIVMILYCCLVFLMVDILVAFCNAAVRAAAGGILELEPPSDEPYLSTSLQDFWGRRWNLTVTNTLRQTVHRPVRAAAEPLLGPQWAAALAILATFLVSGLMHELLFYYVTRVRPTWEMTGFFVFHGFCVVAELWVKRAAGGKWRLPAAVSTPLTVGFTVATSFWLFFPPVMKSGADEMVLGEFKMFMNFFKRNISSIARLNVW